MIATCSKGRAVAQLVLLLLLHLLYFLHLLLDGLLLGGQHGML